MDNRAARYRIILKLAGQSKQLDSYEEALLHHNPVFPTFAPRMSAPLRFLAVLLVLLLIDWYAWRGIHTAIALRSAPFQRAVRWAYWGVSAAMLAVVLISAMRLEKLNGPRNFSYLYTIIGVLLMLLLPKLLIIIFHGLEDLLELMRWAWGKMAPGAAGDTDRGRLRFLSQMGLALATIPFTGVLYGFTRGWRYFNVERITIRSPKLPPAFEGLKIVQISDMHLGSFPEHTEVVQHGVDLINAEDADLILFTGDLVNNYAEEAEPWLEQLRGLKARLGKYAVLGNHDYGDYSQWPDEGAKRANVDRLIGHLKDSGFHVLLDEHVALEREGQRISLIGVQNWGTRFQKYGDLGKAVAGTSPDDFRLLMSHDPTHWDAQVRATGIDLMLSGHTHGAQFGITINGHTYSPAQWVYEEWAGLYEKEGLQLYVNRGFGFIGFPGRVGMPPEITVLTLHRA